MLEERQRIGALEHYEPERPSSPGTGSLTQEDIDRICDGTMFARVTSLGTPIELQHVAGTRIENFRMCNCEYHPMQKGLVTKSVATLAKWTTPNLRRFEIHGTRYMDDSHFHLLAGTLLKLERLDLYKCTLLSDAGLQVFAQCPKLREMRVAACPKVTGESIPDIVRRYVSCSSSQC